MNSLPIKITLDSEYNVRAPKYSFLIDDKLIYSGHIKEETTLAHTMDINDGESFTIKIKFEDKNISMQDTVLDDAGNIISDQRLKLKKIEVDNFNIKDIIWKNGIFTTNEPVNNETEFPERLEWFHNGTYEITIDTPFYIWLLDNM